jgi:hypothetical protein
VTVDCSDTGLQLIPVGVSPSTTNLVLRGNAIKTVLASDLVCD